LYSPAVVIVAAIALRSAATMGVSLAGRKVARRLVGRRRGAQAGVMEGVGAPGHGRAIRWRGGRTAVAWGAIGRRRGGAGGGATARVKVGVAGVGPMRVCADG
jgi:hypothetical protein